MDYKPLTESSELLLLRSLHSRMDLSTKDKLYYENLQKGFDGEKKFSLILKENLPSKSLLLHDLRFEMNNSEFQIDSLLLLNKIYLFEIKNFEGDFYIEGDQWKSMTGTEISNPLHQLMRCEQLLRKLLTELRIKVPIEPYLIFPNPEFTLYQAPLNQTIILPTQLNRLMRQIKGISSHPHNKQHLLAEQ